MLSHVRHRAKDFAILEAVRKWLFFLLYSIEEWKHREVKLLAQGDGATRVWAWDLNLGLSDWKASMNSGDLQKQMAIMFQHPVGLNASFEDGRLHRLLFSFRFYA